MRSYQKHNKRKKGAVDVQFNWIFVLIAGAVILIFFTGLVIRQKDVSEQSINANVLLKLDSIFSAVASSKDTIHIEEIPLTEMYFDSNEFRVGTTSKQLTNNLYFAPRTIKSRKLVPWTLSFRMPYEISRILYITTPDIRYIFVAADTENELLVFANMTLPEALTKEKRKLSDVSDIALNNYDKVKYIFVDVDAATVRAITLPENFKNADEVTAVRLDRDQVQSSITTGHVEFYDMKCDSTGCRFFAQPNIDNPDPAAAAKSIFFDSATLMGAITVDDRDVYDRIMKKLFVRAALVSDVYLDRTYRLNNLGGQCAYFYSSAMDAISAQRSLFSDLSSMDDGFSINSGTDINNLLAQQRALITLNDQAIQYSCAILY